MNSMLTASGGLFLVAIVVAALTSRVIWVGLKSKWSALKCIGVSAGLTFSLLALAALMTDWFSGQPVFDQWGREFDASIARTLEVYEQLGWKAEELKLAGQVVRIFFKDAFAAWVAVLCILFSAVVYSIERRLAPHLAGSKNVILPIEYWKVPDLLIWFTIGALLAIVLGTRWKVLHGLYIAGLNIAVFVAQIYGLIGIGISFFYINKRKWPPLTKVMVILAVGIMPMALFFILALGLFDTWWDWRKLTKPPTEDKQP